MNDIDWFDRFLTIHAQTHLYWRTLVALFVVIFGLLISSKNFEILDLITLLAVLGVVQVIITNAILKLYRLLRASLGELREECNRKDPNSNFSQECQNLEVFKVWHIVVLNLFLFISLIWAAFSRYYV